MAKILCGGTLVTTGLWRRPCSFGDILAATPVVCSLGEAQNTPYIVLIESLYIFNLITAHRHNTPSKLVSQREASHAMRNMMYARSMETDNKEDISFLGHERHMRYESCTASVGERLIVVL